MSVVYNEGAPTEARVLNNINLEIYKNEYVIFFGPSGSGKSTLLYTMAGLETPTTGKIVVSDHKKGFQRDLSTLKEEELVDFHQHFIGMVFQAFYLIPTLNAEDNISLPMILRGAPKNQRRKAAENLMKRFGIFDFRDRFPNELSGGQQQRVAIARSLVNNPQVIFADEPVGNLDSENAAIVVDMISDLKRTDDKTVVHVTHDPRHLALADRVFYLKDGEITRVVVNRDVRKPSKYKSTGRRSAIMGKLASEHPYASENELKAKMISNNVLSSYTHHEMSRIESIVEKFINQEIDEKEMKRLFDVPEEKGGVNLYKQTATKLAKEISAIVKEIELVEHESENHVPMRDQAMELLHFVLDDYEVEINGVQEQRAIEACAYRLAGGTSFEELAEILSNSVRDGGVGLNKRTAQKIANEIEILITDAHES